MTEDFVERGMAKSDPRQVEVSKETQRDIDSLNSCGTRLEMLPKSIRRLWRNVTSSMYIPAIRTSSYGQMNR